MSIERESRKSYLLALNVKPHNAPPKQYGEGRNTELQVFGVRTLPFARLVRLFFGAADKGVPPAVVASLAVTAISGDVAPTLQGNWDVVFEQQAEGGSQTVKTMISWLSDKNNAGFDVGGKTGIEATQTVAVLEGMRNLYEKGELSKVIKATAIEDMSARYRWVENVEDDIYQSYAAHLAVSTEWQESRSLDTEEFDRLSAELIASGITMTDSTEVKFYIAWVAAAEVVADAEQSGKSFEELLKGLENILPEQEGYNNSQVRSLRRV